MGGVAAAELTFGAKPSRDVGFGWGHISQTQSAFIKVLVGEEVSQADVEGFVCNVHTKLLQEKRRREGGGLSMAS